MRTEPFSHTGRQLFDHGTDRLERRLSTRKQISNMTSDNDNESTSSVVEFQTHSRTLAESFASAAYFAYLALSSRNKSNSSEQSSCTRKRVGIEELDQ